MNGTANFTIEKTWGYKNPKTGEFDGMNGQLMRKEADIGGTIVYMVPARIPQMDFISMIVDTRAELVFRAPPLSYASNIFYYPFTGTVWITTIVLTVISSIVIYLTYVLPNESTRDHIRDAFSDVILLASGLISQMGLHVNPRIISGQISSVKYYSLCFNTVYEFWIFFSVHSIDMPTVCVYVIYRLHSWTATVDLKKHFYTRRHS